MHAGTGFNSSTGLVDFRIRSTGAEDCPQILAFIKELAAYEKLSHEVVATVKTLQETLFGEHRYAEVLIGEFEQSPVGYALFFHNFSTFTGRPGIYLEDIYIQPAMRGKGFGKSMLAYIARLAVERRCTRVEWSVLDWNEPAIQFYRSIAATPLNGWTVQRLDGAELAHFAEQFQQSN